MVCLPQETCQSFLLPISARADSPRFESRDELCASASGLSWENAMRRLFLLSLALPVTMLMSTASLAQSKLDASILSYDGKDFTRTETTLMEQGKAAVGTKLDANSDAYKALVEGHSYTGAVTVFGKNYQGNYAPLMGADGKVTGALFVGVAK